MRRCINETKVEFPAKSENEGFARTAVSAFIAPLDPFVSELAELKTAVSEAVTNAIVHGYRGIKGGKVMLQIKLFSDRKVYIKIRDKGRGIEDIPQAMQPLYTSAPEEERAGLGFAVMESFTDRLRVKSSVGKGTCVVMEKTLRERENEDTDGYGQQSGREDTQQSGAESGTCQTLCE